jgi:hypothetical protein
VDPTDPNALYIRSGDDYDGYGLRKSVDGGATWSYTNFYTNSFYAFAIDSAHPFTLYAGTDNGIVQSTDGGGTWNSLGFANVYLLAVDPVRTGTLYAATVSETSGFQGLFKSLDEGTTWSPVNRGLENILANRAPVNALLVDPVETGVLYLATGGYGVFRSVDGAARWAALNDGLTNLDVRALTIIPSQAHALYAGNHRTTRPCSLIALVVEAHLFGMDEVPKAGVFELGEIPGVEACGQHHHAAHEERDLLLGNIQVRSKHLVEERLPLRPRQP